MRSKIVIIYYKLERYYKLGRNTPFSIVNPKTANLNNLNFYQLEIVSRYRVPQLQVDENYSYLSQSCCLNTHFVPKNCNLNS